MQRQGWGIYFHTPEGKVEFMCPPQGIHHLDLSQPKKVVLMLAMALQEQFEGYTKTQIDGIAKARCLQAMFEHPLQQQFKKFVCEKLIMNFPCNKKCHDKCLQTIWLRPYMTKRKDSLSGPYLNTT